ncbi:hypothetical protein CRUP_030530, partial [Coryphaenoides rupestris]
QWFTATMNLLGTWLTERMDQQLHVYQLKILIRIAKKKYRDFRLQGVLDSTLNSKMYDTSACRGQRAEGRGVRHRMRSNSAERRVMLEDVHRKII